MIRHNVPTEGRGQAWKRREWDVSGVHSKIRSTSSAHQQHQQHRAQPEPGHVDASWRSKLLGASPTVALGKFDALHRGHQKLVATAANLKPSSTPYLISFDGMADVLGWEPRLPLVAMCDRPRVLASWEKVCAGTVPQERGIPFSQVRHLSPEEFVSLLAEDLGAVGVVVGSNYRFGYKAAGTAETLKNLGAAYGMKVEIVNLVERTEKHDGSSSGYDGKAGHAGLGDTVSSSAVREGLASGDLVGVKECMGRPYRLVGFATCLMTEKNEASARATNGQGAVTRWRIDPAECMNQYPAAGGYEVRVGFSTEETGRAKVCGGDFVETFYPGYVVFDARGVATIDVEAEMDTLLGLSGDTPVAERRWLCALEFL